MSSWRLDKDQAWIAGVCAGLARHWGINPIWVRVGAIVTGVYLTKIALIAYGVAWIIVDSDR